MSKGDKINGLTKGSGNLRLFFWLYIWFVFLCHFLNISVKQIRSHLLNVDMLDAGVKLLMECLNNDRRCQNDNHSSTENNGTLVVLKDIRFYIYVEIIPTLGLGFI